MMTTRTTLLWTWLSLLGIGALGCQSTARYSGESIYLSSCANCHGRYGEGDGPAAPSLALTMQDLRYLSARNDGVFPREMVEGLIDGRERRAAHGGDMPIWGDVFKLLEGDAVPEGDVAGTEGRVAERIRALTGYLESMQVPPHAQ